ncbi:MAG: hypothetical protein JG764_1764 [Clostridiales bacterium]|jgi:hypothetical protein|nr:hypothetical protein [Clostridiales bacterium]
MSKSSKIPQWLEKFFWDVKVEELDLQKHRIFIIERLLNEGNHRSLEWIFKNYSQETIQEAVMTSRGLSLKTARCWQNYFGLREDEMRCFGVLLTDLGRFY